LGLQGCQQGELIEPQDLQLFDTVDDSDDESRSALDTYQLRYTLGWEDVLAAVGAFQAAIGRRWRFRAARFQPGHQLPAIHAILTPGWVWLAAVDAKNFLAHRFTPWFGYLFCPLS
jgi:hypothetical protein